MLDFVEIVVSTKATGPGNTVTYIYPEFLVKESYKDLMIRGGSFYAVWDEEAGFWTQKVARVQKMVDDAIREKYDELAAHISGEIRPMYLGRYGSKKWSEFMAFCTKLGDNFVQLDQTLKFLGESSVREDYITETLPYAKSTDIPKAYNQLMETLYSPEDRRKIEWAVGSIFVGDSKAIQKFLVLYGDSGTGKSTVLNIIAKLFQGHCVAFDAKSLANSSNSFSMEVFRDNPLVAIQHDGDLSRIKDNTRLNSIVSHENMVINEKRKTQYSIQLCTFIFMGTNRPVEITETKSGLIRRLIDVNPTGNTVEVHLYNRLISLIEFELGAIAVRCMNVYAELGPNAYDRYRPNTMMSETNDVYNFVQDYYDVFVKTNPISLNTIWLNYKQWCDESGLTYRMHRRALGNELKGYFTDFKERDSVLDKEGKRVWLYKTYYGFKREIFEVGQDTVFTDKPDKPIIGLKLDKYESLIDDVLADCPAQYASPDGVPMSKWSLVSTKLSDIDTKELHYVRVPETHIVIDFDIKDSEGNKDRAANLEAASKWPPTYAELSQGEHGVHLHYEYDGDVRKLSNIYAKDIEIKVFTGYSALRRRVSLCNDLPVATLKEGTLPFKKGDDRKVMDFEGLKNEKALRTLIAKNLRKEIHPGTKPSIDFIYKILEDSYSQGMAYDVTDLRPAIMAFANNSTNHSTYCVKLVSRMKFQSEKEPETLVDIQSGNDEIMFYDVEVFPNLFIVCCKYAGKDSEVQQMINPTADMVEKLVKHNRLVGFNNRRYDNHILYAAMLGYTNYQLYTISQRLVSGSMNATFKDAYNLSYADVYDFASTPNRKSLKKWEIELGIHHQENEYPWDEPLDESRWQEVADYCANDVRATEAVFNHLHDDYTARLILAKLGNGTPNDPTRTLLTRFIFAGDKDPVSKLQYTDLSVEFPGYTFDHGKSSYRGVDPGEGGYVYAEPGMYENVALFDVASMHPASIIALNYLGPYTQRYADIREARIAIKHGDFEKAKTMLDGQLAPFLEDPDIDNKALANALKTALNSLYGYTKASFDCPFKHPLNKDNIIAKRGALFMVNLKEEVQKRGYTVAHIKTDSIKIPNADEEIKKFIFEYGKEYGYDFEHEATYDKMCLVNNAVYVAHDSEGWHATGAQFQVPYVFKTLFSGEELIFEDYTEIKSVSNASMYIDVNRDPENPEYKFVGRVGQFCPMLESVEGAGILLVYRNEKYDAVSGTKGYLWRESELVRLGNEEDGIDFSYFDKLAEKAVNTISEYGDFDEFVRV